jgi:hypothetical protein
MTGPPFAPFYPDRRTHCLRAFFCRRCCSRCRRSRSRC